MTMLYICGAILLAVSLACIPFGERSMSVLDRWRGPRRPLDKDSKGIE